MRVLAFDTALEACSVAVWADGQILAQEIEMMPRGQAEALMPMIIRVMEAASTTFDGLDRLGVTVGPGAFTGIRIALAAARGMALVRRIPAIGVTTLEAVARGVEPLDGRGLLVVLDVGRPDLYVQAFGSDMSELTPISAASPAVAAKILEGPVVLAGNGAPRVAPLLEARSVVFNTRGSGLPDAANVAEIAAHRALDSMHPDVRGPQPLYVHPHYAKLPSARSRR